MPAKRWADKPDMMDDFMLQQPGGHRHRSGVTSSTVWAVIVLVGLAVVYAYISGWLVLPTEARNLLGQKPATNPSPSNNSALGTGQTLSPDSNLPNIKIGQSVSATEALRRQRKPTSLTGTVTDQQLKDVIPGVVVIVGTKTDKLPSQADLFNPVELVKQFKIADDRVAYQQDSGGFVIDIPDAMTDAKIIAPCYVPLSLSVADLKANPNRTLKRSCPDNAFFGQVYDTVSGKGTAVTITLKTSSNTAGQALKVDSSGYFTASISNDKTQNFIFDVIQPSFKEAGFKGGIDSTSGASNTWQDIPLLPDLNGAKY